jgi:hypothetical protein
MREVLAPGSRFPDIRLPEHTGKQVEAGIEAEVIVIERTPTAARSIATSSKPTSRKKAPGWAARPSMGERGSYTASSAATAGPRFTSGKAAKTKPTRSSCGTA